MRIGFIVKCDSICGWIWIAIANCASFRECTWHKYCNFSLCALHTQSVSLHTQRLKAFNIHTTRTIRSSSRTTMFEVVALKLSQWIPNQSKYFHLYSLDLGMQFWGVAKKSDTLETHKRESERERMEKGGGGGWEWKRLYCIYHLLPACVGDATAAVANAMLSLLLPFTIRFSHQNFSSGTTARRTRESMASTRKHNGKEVK